MPRYVAFLRGVSPMNAKMPELKRSFESAGFTNVRTVRSSGNVVFDASARSVAALARDAQAAMTRELGRTFYTVVRPVSQLRKLLGADPYAAFRVPASAKRVVTFLGTPPRGNPKLPLMEGGVRILTMTEREVFTVYVPDPLGPDFMTLIEKTFGTHVTTRTWDTVERCATA